MDHPTTTQIIHSLEDAIKIGGILAASELYERINEQEILARILRGQELGIPPLAAVENIRIIDGKTALSAHMIAAKIAASDRYRADVLVSDKQSCAIRFTEQVDGRWDFIGFGEFSLEDARSANLLQRKEWQRYPKAMLRARAMAQGARWLCASLFGGGIYIPDELEEGSDICCTAEMQTNSQRISTLLNNFGISDLADRQDIVGKHLGDRRAATLSDHELEVVLEAISQDILNDSLISAATSAVAAQPESTAVPTLSNIAQIADLLDELGIADVNERQLLLKLELARLKRQKVEDLTPDELQSLLIAIQQSKAVAT